MFMENLMTDKHCNSTEFYRKDIFIIIFFLISSIGLISLLNMVSISMTEIYEIDSLNRWVINFWYPEKPSEIMHYILCLLGIAMYYLIYFYISKKQKLYCCKFKRNLSSLSNIVFILFIALVINIVVSMNIRPGIHNILPRGIFWAGMFIAPFVLDFKNFSEKIIFMMCRLMRKKVLITLMAITIINLIYLIYPFVFQKLKIINEFWDVPEKTFVGNKLIDNNTYINENKLVSNENKYDIKTNITSRENKKFFYKDNDGINLVGSIDSIIDNSNEKDRLYLRWLYLDGKWNDYKADNYKDMKEFVENNSYEMHWQILNRFWIHHHNHVLGPINEINLGKDIGKVYMQYGWLNTVMLKGIMNKMGGISYQNYSKILNSFYYIYYALFVMLMFMILGQIEYVLPITMLLAAGLNKISYPFLYIAPGVNPIRHFLDIFVISLFYIYLQDKEKVINKLCLVMSVIVAVASIFNNSQVGLFVLIALIATLVVKNLIDREQRSFFELAIIFIAFMLGVAAEIYSNVGVHYMTEYFKGGLLGFLLPDYIFILIFIVVGICYVLLMKQYNMKNDLKHICILLLLYSQGLLIYYVWGSDLNHFIVYSPLFVFTILLILKLSIDNYKLSDVKKTYIHAGILLFAITLYVPSLSTFVKNKVKFDEIFETHLTYEWKLPNANFISTMNPDYFVDSIKLIKKHTSSNEIYILSKYDSILPFIAGKYSAMPYFDVSWYLISDKEVSECIKCISENKPKILFADTDIDRSYKSDIVEKWSLLGYLHDESLWRYQRLSMLKKIFDAIKNQYVPVERALLITVYERK